MRKCAAARRGGQERQIGGLAGEMWRGGGARRVEKFTTAHQQERFDRAGATKVGQE